MSKISLINAGKKIEKTQIIKNLNMEISINPPKMYGFVGPNGAGKTSTMKLISGLYFPNKGRIEFENTSQRYDNLSKGNVDYIPAGERGLFYNNFIFYIYMYYVLSNCITP